MDQRRSEIGDCGSATLVAIAKNEAPYILEWVAYHLAVGFDRILVYDNGSSDRTLELASRLAQVDPRVSARAWPTVPGQSPQVTAYDDALRRASTTWVAFFDVDEFLVPFGYGGVHDLLGAIPADVASFHVNWRGFGSSGRETEDYGLVTRAFSRAAPKDWSNNHHYKTIVRTDHAVSAMIHDVSTVRGRRVLSDFSEFISTNNGVADRVVHHGVQINHYQCKTYGEFARRMRIGDAADPLRERDASWARFSQIDRNEELDERIRSFDSAFDVEYRSMLSKLGEFASEWFGDAAMRPRGGDE